MNYRKPASKAAVLSFMAALAHHAKRPVERQAYIAELLTVIAFGVVNAPKGHS